MQVEQQVANLLSSKHIDSRKLGLDIAKKEDLDPKAIAGYYSPKKIDLESFKLEMGESHEVLMYNAYDTEPLTMDVMSYSLCRAMLTSGDSFMYIKKVYSDGKPPHVIDSHRWGMSSRSLEVAVDTFNKGIFTILQLHRDGLEKIINYYKTKGTLGPLDKFLTSK